MNLDTIMTRQVVTVSPDHSMAAVREIFQQHAFHHLVVVEAGKVVGVVSDRDLLKNLSPFIGRSTERSQDSFLLQRKVHQVMSRQLVAATTTTPIKVAMAMLLQHKVSCIPVVDEAGACAGIVTWHDMLGYALECGVEPGCTPRRGAA